MNKMKDNDILHIQKSKRNLCMLQNLGQFLLVGNKDTKRRINQFSNSIEEPLPPGLGHGNNYQKSYHSDIKYHMTLNIMFSDTGLQR